MLEHFYISMFILAISLSVCAIVFMSKIKLSFKLLIAVILTASSIFTYRALNEIRGYPVVLQVSFKDTLIISHMLDEESKIIYVWAKIKHDKSPRSYVVPFKDNVAQFLEKMRKKHKGKPYRAKIKVNSNQTSPLNKSIESMEMGELMVFPTKR